MPEKFPAARIDAQDSAEDETRLYSYEKAEAPTDAKRVMLTFDNPGAYAGLSPVAEALVRDPRCRGISILASGWASQAFSSDNRFSTFAEKRSVPTPPHAAEASFLADTLKESEVHRPDVVIASVSVRNGPESLALFAGKSNFGAKKLFLFLDGWGSAPPQLKDNPHGPMPDIDAIFCCDDVAKKLAMRQMPAFAPDTFVVTGSPSIDAMYVENSELFTEAARQKLNLASDQIAILYSGDVSDDYKKFDDVDSDDIDHRTYKRLHEAVRRAARENPGKKFALLVRPHPRGPETKKEQLIATALSMETADNMEVKKVDLLSGFSSVESVWAADAVASIISTQNFLASRVGRASIFLSLDEGGMGEAVARHTYGDLVSDIEAAEPLASFVRDTDELVDIIAHLERAPAHVEKPASNSTHILVERILSEA